MEEENKEIDKIITAEKPTLQFSVPCDGVAKGPNNKPVFVGIFSSILRPSIIPQFFIANRILIYHQNIAYNFYLISFFDATANCI